MTKELIDTRKEPESKMASSPFCDFFFAKVQGLALPKEA
jgi:hypothetical protein